MVIVSAALERHLVAATRVGIRRIVGMRVLVGTDVVGLLFAGIAEDEPVPARRYEILRHFATMAGQLYDGGHGLPVYAGAPAVSAMADAIAVVDAHGGLVGIATPRFARFGAIAVPAPTVNRVVDVLLQKGRIPRGYLGVGLQPVRLPDALRRTLKRDDKTAAIVLEVEPEGPAHKAGIVIGDILVALAGQAITRLEDVHGQLGAESIGKSLPIRFIRGGAVQEANIVVAERAHGAN